MALGSDRMCKPPGSGAAVLPARYHAPAVPQCQAIVVGFLASTAAVVMGWIPDGEFDLHHTLLLCASSVVTASLASLILGVCRSAAAALPGWAPRRCTWLHAPL